MNKGLFGLGFSLVFVVAGCAVESTDGSQGSSSNLDRGEVTMQDPVAHAGPSADLSRTIAVEGDVKTSDAPRAGQLAQNLGQKDDAIARTIDRDAIIVK